MGDQKENSRKGKRELLSCASYLNKQSLYYIFHENPHITNLTATNVTRATVPGFTDRRAVPCTVQQHDANGAHDVNSKSRLWH